MNIVPHLGFAHNIGGSGGLKNSFSRLSKINIFIRDKELLFLRTAAFLFGLKAMQVALLTFNSCLLKSYEFQLKMVQNLMFKKLQRNSSLV
jgi:hypothetical protein